jgi:hypothetical protein
MKYNDEINEITEKELINLGFQVRDSHVSFDSVISWKK